jgi:glycerol-3-phosphate acyltransferase PlsY
MIGFEQTFALARMPDQGLWVFLAAYVLGCFTTGYYLVRLVAHKDIRQCGSGSAGARNVGRLLGPFGFFTVLLFDFGKGALAVGLTRHFTADESLAMLAMLAVAMGHIWPAQLHFHGGKGVATSLGALLVYDYHLALAFAAVCMLGLLFTRNFNVSGLLAFSLLPVADMAFKRSPATGMGISCLAALILFAHRKNLEDEIVRLMARRDTDPKPEQKI